MPSIISDIPKGLLRTAKLNNFYYFRRIFSFGTIGKKRYIAARIAGAFIILLLGLLVVLQVPAVQTRLARFATERLGSAIDGTLHIDAIQFHPFNAVTVKNAVILDNEPYTEDINGRGFHASDTLVSIGSLSASLSLHSLLHKGGLSLNRVDLEDVYFQLVTEPDSVWGSNMARIFRIKSDTENKVSLDTIFTIRHAEIRNARYRMLNFGPQLADMHGKISYEDMDATVIEASARDIGFYGGRMHAMVDRMSAHEKSGYDILDVSGSCAVGLGKTEIRDLHMADGFGSDINLETLTFSYADTKAWAHFIDEVEIDGVFRPTHLLFKSISQFAGGSLDALPLELDLLSGHYKGPVNGFTVSGMHFENLNGMSGTVNGRADMITDFPHAVLDARVSGLHFTTANLQEMLATLGLKTSLSSIAPHQDFVLDASALGPVNHLAATAGLASPLTGNASVDASIDGLFNGSPRLGARLLTDNLDLGKILGVEALGQCSMSASASATLGKSLEAELESARISRLGLLGHDYEGILISAALDGPEVSAAVESSDPAALFSAEGNFNLDNQWGRLSASFPHLDLAAMNLDKRGDSSLASFSLAAEQGMEKDNPVHLHVSGLRLQNDSGAYVIGDVDAGARLSDDMLTAMLSSDFADAKYYGPSDLGALVSFVRGVSVDASLPAFFSTAPPGGEPASPADATISAVLHDTDGLLAFLLPGAQIARETELNIDIDSEGRLLGYLSSPLLRMNGIVAEGSVLALDNTSGELRCSLSTDKFSLGAMSFDDMHLGVDAARDTARIFLDYQGADVLDGGSELSMQAMLGRDAAGTPDIRLNTGQSTLRIKDDVWELAPSQICYTGGRLAVDRFRLLSERQGISADGGISPDSPDTLRLNFTHVDIAVLNDFLSNLGHSFRGIIDGHASLVSPLKASSGMGADLSISGLGIDAEEAGDIRLLSRFDAGGKKLFVRLTDTLDEVQTLKLSGRLGLDDGTLDGTAVFDRFDAGIAAPFLSELFPVFEGRLHGSVHAGGKIVSPVFDKGSLRLDAFKLRVGPTNVLYTVNGTVGVHEGGLSFNSIGIADEYGGLGTLGGGLNFHGLKNFRLDANADMHRLKAIDAPEPGAIGIYGDLAVTGSARVSGPFDSLNIEGDLSTAGSGNIHVPIGSSANAQGSDLLVFAAPAAGEEEQVPETTVRARKTSGKLSVHARVNISPEVSANVEIDKDSGHMLSASGSGTVTADINTASDIFKLKGDYSIDKGKYLLNIPGLVGKEFDIRQGSSIKFNGDIAESSLDISAIHNVKTALTTLVADSTSVSSRRLVECAINIGGRLLSPEVSFSIDVPDLDPNTKMKVDAALSTEDKIQKQFVALMLFGTFLPDERSGVVNGTNMLLSNVGEIVSSQLNNILQKLDIPLDFGLGYQQDNVGTDIFDVAVSTQLFNNRVLVNGSVGNRKYSTSKSAGGDMVGDLDIEIKIDRSGEVRFKLFSHSADEFSSSLDFSQRNGIGVSYQKEFDRFKDFFRQMFMSRSRKAQEALVEAEKKKAMKTIVIDGSD